MYTHASPRDIVSNVVCVQVELKEAMDLRHAALGPRGYKLKPVKSGLSSLRKVQQAAEQQQQEPQGMDTDAAEPEPYAAPAVKRQRAEGVAYRNVSACFARLWSKHQLLALSKALDVCVRTLDWVAEGVVGGV